MSDILDGTYAIIATSLTGCLAGVCVICCGQLEGGDFEGGRFSGAVCLRDEVVELNFIMEGPIVPSGVCDGKARQLLRLRETISATEWAAGSSIFLQRSGTWLILRQIASAASVDHIQGISRRAA